MTSMLPGNKGLSSYADSLAWSKVNGATRSFVRRGVCVYVYVYAYIFAHHDRREILNFLNFLNLFKSVAG